MDYLVSLAGFGESLLFTILPFLFVLTVVVFFHELGHFLVARFFGVKVETFSIGFGPEIWGFNDRKGTRWRFAWIPLGGYVKFIDDEGVASLPRRDEDETSKDTTPQNGSFHSKPLWQRALVIFAGPAANFILAIVLFAGMFATLGERVTLPLVDEVVAGGAADRAGFKPGDLVVEVNGTKIETFSELQRIVSVNPERPLRFVVKRGDRLVELTATPERREIVDRFGNRVRLGILGVKRRSGPDGWTVRHYDPISAVGKGISETYFVVARTLGYLYEVVAGRESADQLGGPIRIAQISSQMATVGMLALLNLVAILSVSIGLINLFPIPMLDGGHLLFYAIEAVRGKPVSERVMEISFRVGLALLLMLMIFATWNDLVHTFGGS